VDHESLTHKVIGALQEENYSKYRAVLVDEVQDLTQNDLKTIGFFKTTEGSLVKDAVNGFFLVGDGAQTIYKNGFSLKKIGINVSVRSFAFKKNYRNTKQILEAAYALIENFDCSNLDEDDVTKPIPPELAKQNGGRPQIIKTYTQSAECAFVVEQILKLKELGAYIGNVCIIGLTKSYRSLMQEALKACDIPYCEIRDNVQTRNDVVKISTIESAKGHEFSTVFITGLAVPHDKDLSEEEMPIEASRLYVAMTRACNNVFLSYCTSFNYVPSPLLMYIQDFCEEKEMRA
jgi:superfamily I DNA/RNA helicase